MISQRSRSVGQTCTRTQFVALGRSAWRCFTLSVVGLATVIHQARGQAPNGSRAQNSEVPVLPQPLVSASFTPPTHPINWSAYHQWEECEVAFQRMEGMAKYQAFLPGMSTNRSADTLHWGGAFPIDSTVVQLPRACLQRFRITEIPPIILAKVRQLASHVNADSLFQTIVAQQLATLPANTIQPRAELLSAVILDLLDDAIMGQGEGISTPAHERMARAYIAQLDGLGPTVWEARLNVRTAFLNHISRHTYDLDAQLALLQEERQIVQQPEVQQLPEMQAPSGLPHTTVGEMKRREIDHETLEIHYYQTLSHDSLAKLEQPRHDIEKMWGREFPAPLRWLNVQAPQLHCDYYFPTPQATTPQVGASPVLPPTGQLSLVVFYNRDIYYDQDNVLTMLRRVHRDLPTLPVTFVDNTIGQFGTLSGQDVVEDPMREVVLLHHEIVDTLGLVGSLCVNPSQLQKTPDGHVMLRSDVNTLAWHHNGGWMVYIVDPTGIVVGFHDFSINKSPGGLSGGIAFEWYLKRLAAKYGVAQSSHSGGTP